MDDVELKMFVNFVSDFVDSMKGDWEKLNRNQELNFIKMSLSLDDIRHFLDKSGGMNGIK